MMEKQCGREEAMDRRGVNWRMIAEQLGRDKPSKGEHLGRDKPREGKMPWTRQTKGKIEERCLGRDKPSGGYA